LDIAKRIQQIHQKILSKQDHFSHFIDHQLSPPQPFIGDKEIRLIVLGQDPTVKNPKSRKKIKTTLNLDKNGKLKKYISQICDGLGIDLEKNVYATNVIKCFFIKPPTLIKEIDVLNESIGYWIDLLKEEVAQFPASTIISLGEPVLSILVKNGSKKLRDYWEYSPKWKSGVQEKFSYIRKDNSILNRSIFPFPHQPSISKQLYNKRFNNYLKFVMDKTT
jgi:uracil-DNA glycosylase